MKIFEILTDNSEWDKRLKETIKELKVLLGDDIKFTGGYCFHLALAMFLKYPGISIIADGGHAVAYHQEDDISMDSTGIHKSESALREPPVKIWKTADGLIKSVRKGWSVPKQIEDLELVKQHFSGKK